VLLTGTCNKLAHLLWSTHALIQWLAHLLTHWLAYSLTGSLAYSLTGSLTYSLTMHAYDPQPAADLTSFKL